MYRVHVAHRDTGAETTIDVKSATPQGAEHFALNAGYLIRGIEMLPKKAWGVWPRIGCILGGVIVVIVGLGIIGSHAAKRDLAHLLASSEGSFTVRADEVRNSSMINATLDFRKDKTGDDFFRYNLDFCETYEHTMTPGISSGEPFFILRINAKSGPGASQAHRIYWMADSFRFETPTIWEGDGMMSGTMHLGHLQAIIKAKVAKCEIDGYGDPLTLSESDKAALLKFSEHFR